MEKEVQADRADSITERLAVNMHLLKGGTHRSLHRINWAYASPSPMNVKTGFQYAGRLGLSKSHLTMAQTQTDEAGCNAVGRQSKGRAITTLSQKGHLPGLSCKKENLIMPTRTHVKAYLKQINW